MGELGKGSGDIKTEVPLLLYSDMDSVATNLCGLRWHKVIIVRKREQCTEPLNALPRTTMHVCPFNGYPVVKFSCILNCRPYLFPGTDIVFTIKISL